MTGSFISQQPDSTSDGDGRQRVGNHDWLMATAEGFPPLATAVVYPVDPAAMSAVFDACDAGIINPTLVGPAAMIRSCAQGAGLDIDRLVIMDTPTAVSAAAMAAELAAEGRIEALMKGSVHTNTLLHGLLKAERKLRERPWMSHTFVFDVPSYPKALLLSDAVIAVAPDLEQKAAICRNAIKVAGALGIENPKVAILSAVEDVEPSIGSTIDAAALCKMAERGQITGAVLDGPLAMDNAISPDAAATKRIVSPVAGQADILIVPNIEAGNILYKSLTYLAGANVAGVVVGATVPVMLASRADSVRNRVASAALASIVANSDKSVRLNL